MAEATPLTDAFCDAAVPPQDRNFQVFYDPLTRGFGVRVDFATEPRALSSTTVRGEFSVATRSAVLGIRGGWARRGGGRWS